MLKGLPKKKHKHAAQGLAQAVVRDLMHDESSLTRYTAASSGCASLDGYQHDSPDYSSSLNGHGGHSH